MFSEDCGKYMSDKTRLLKIKPVDNLIKQIHELISKNYFLEIKINIFLEQNFQNAVMEKNIYFTNCENQFQITIKSIKMLFSY